MNSARLIPITRRTLAGTMLLSALAASAPLGPAQAAHTPASMRSITIRASRPSFPTSFNEGMLALRLVADARIPYGVGIVRVNPGIKMAQVQAASADFMKLTRLVTFLGGVLVPAQHKGTVVVDLRTPGRYALRLSAGDSGAGRTFLFGVTSSSVQNTVPLRTDVTVTLQGSHFAGLPGVLRAGRTTFKVSDGSTWVRKMLFFRLDPGKTVADFLAASERHQEPSWVHDAGGMDVLSPQQTAWLTQRLTPGTYVADCPLPDPSRGGKPFDLEGMIASFTVS